MDEEVIGRRRPDGGFSLIELVVVIAVIGVLAAIALPVYVGAQTRASEAAVQSDLVNARAAIVAFAGQHDGLVPSAVSRDGAATGAAGTADLQRDGWSRGASTADLAYSASSAGWCLVATSSTGARFALAAGGAVERASTCR